VGKKEARSRLFITDITKEEEGKVAGVAEQLPLPHWKREGKHRGKVAIQAEQSSKEGQKMTTHPHEKINQKTKEMESAEEKRPILRRDRSTLG